MYGLFCDLLCVGDCVNLGSLCVCECEVCAGVCGVYVWCVYVWCVYVWCVYVWCGCVFVWWGVLVFVDFQSNSVIHFCSVLFM